MYWSFIFSLIYMHLHILCMASSHFSFLQNEVSRIYPSPLGPKPTPGVVTT